MAEDHKPKTNSTKNPTSKAPPKPKADPASQSATKKSANTETKSAAISAPKQEAAAEIEVPLKIKPSTKRNDGFSKLVPRLLFGFSITLFLIAIAIYSWPRYDTEQYYKAVETGNCQKCNLRGADLQGTDLSGGDFQGSDLTKARFRGSDLQGVNFSNANLTGVDFSKKVFYMTKFIGANLTDADFRIADLRNANMQQAILKNTDFSEAIWINGQRCKPKSIDKCNFDEQKPNANK